MVPLALGTQTNGSVVRPASFCGVVGFKPSRGLISRRGVLVQSPTLDAIGTFSRTVEDAALLADVLAGYDESDPGSTLSARPDLLNIAQSRPPAKPRFAFVRSPVWDRAQAEVREGFAELAEALGDRAEEVELPEPFAQAHEWHRAIMLADIARNYVRYLDRDPAGLSSNLIGMIERGLPSGPLITPMPRTASRRSIRPSSGSSIAMTQS
jgi:Asp-tRNA(Asn)/Glu-tRNA(Gln) amidotransferase A subunit family amidase